jgi:hypothetical protein
MAEIEKKRGSVGKIFSTSKPKVARWNLRDSLFWFLSKNEKCAAVSSAFPIVLCTNQPFVIVGLRAGGKW